MTGSECIRLLKLHRSTRGLPDEALTEIAEHAEIFRPEEGEWIQEAGKPIEFIHLVLAGRLSICIELPGKHPKPVLYVGRDEQVGLLTHLQDETSVASVRAEQPCTLIRIPGEQAVELMKRFPSWGRNLLKALGPRLRDSFLGNKKVDRKRLVFLIHTQPSSRHLTADLAEQLTYLGENVGLVSDRDDVLEAEVAHSMSLRGERGQRLPLAEIRESMAAWSDADRIIVDCEFELASRELDELLRSGQAIYWVCDSRHTNDVIDAMQPQLRNAPGLRDKVFVIRILDRHERVAEKCPELNEVCAGDFKYHWDGCEVDSLVCTQRAGMRRILHHLRGVSIGLALGGGAARGMAHLGVLRVLENAGITIDRMSGTSAGALVGVPFCGGLSANAMTNAFSRDLKPGWMYRFLPYGDAFYALAKYRLGGWQPMLRKYLFDWTLDQLPVPFSSVAVDLISAEPVIRRVTDATDAILESINLPGIARPICRDGMALVDGGILNVVPADVLANQESNFIISSDVSSRIAFEVAGNVATTPTAAMKPIGGIAGAIRSRTVQDRSIRNVGGAAADIVIEPDVASVDLTDFKHAHSIAELGRSAAEAALPQIKRELHQLDARLFPA